MITRSLFALVFALTLGFAVGCDQQSTETSVVDSGDVSAADVAAADDAYEAEMEEGNEEGDE